MRSNSPAASSIRHDRTERRMPRCRRPAMLPEAAMAPRADVCLIVEGGYPYILGGVASWMDALMRASPHVTFHIIAITISSQPKVRKFDIPANVVGILDVVLDVSPAGARPTYKDKQHIEQGVRLLQEILS